MKNNEKKPTMIIVSTLFFNRLGNQSLLETVKQYAKKYRIIFITSASKKNDYYITLEEANMEFDSDIIFYHVYQTVPNFLRRLKKIILYFKYRIKKIIVSKTDSSLQNMSYTRLTLLSAAIAGFFLYHKLKKLARKYSPDLICAYEVFAVKSVLRVKRKLSNKNVKYLAKFQGTVLGFDYKNIDDPLIYKKYKPDIDAFKLCKEFDVCAITNDGTNGDKVLGFFGVDAHRILYDVNGISSHIKEIKKHTPIQSNFNDVNPIWLFTLSRLIGWKRVNLSIEIMNVLVNKFQNHRFKLNIYGYGTNAEINVLTNLIKIYDLDKYVTICGAVSHDNLSSVYSSNHIMLSLYKYTNVTNPLLEAIYLNKPLITLHDDNLDAILRNIETDRIYIINNVNENKIVNDIASYLDAGIFAFSTLDNKTDELFDWGKRIEKEIALLMEV